MKSAAQSELGAQTADGVNNVPPIEVRTLDPGAVGLVDSIRSAPAIATRSATSISLEPIRNFSKCGSSERRRMTERLADLLSEAGSEWNLTFLPAGETADFEMTGSAYMVPGNGFDLWELYLAIRPRDESISIWERPGPVRLLRQAPVSGQQIFLEDVAN